MADRTHAHENQNALHSGSNTLGKDESSVTSQDGQPNEMRDRGQSDASKGDRFDRKPEQTGGADAMKNEGGNQSSSDMRKKGMSEDEKGPNERTSRASRHD